MRELRSPKGFATILKAMEKRKMDSKKEDNQQFHDNDSYEPGFVFKEYDRGANRNQNSRNDSSYSPTGEETAETESHRPLN
jgi:hypothetical protein